MPQEATRERRARLETIKADYSLCWVTDNSGSNFIVRYIVDGSNKIDLVPKNDVVSLAYMTD